MFIPFEEIPADSRIWIYQADRKLNDEEVEKVQQKTKSFLNDWAAHGSKLACSSKIFYDQFLVLAVYEGFHQPSGCSIDNSVRFIQSLENWLNLSFMDRSKVAFLIDGNLHLETLNGVKKSVEEGHINQDTLVFNNLIDRKEGLENTWLIKAKDSWINRYFKVKI